MALVVGETGQQIAPLQAREPFENGGLETDHPEDRACRKEVVEKKFRRLNSARRSFAPGLEAGG